MDAKLQKLQEAAERLEARLSRVKSALAASGQSTPQSAGQAASEEDVLLKTAEVFGYDEGAVVRLITPGVGLGGRIPLDLLGAPKGREEVMRYLHQIDAGVYI